MIIMTIIIYTLCGIQQFGIAIFTWRSGSNLSTGYEAWGFPTIYYHCAWFCFLVCVGRGDHYVIAFLYLLTWWYYCFIDNIVKYKVAISKDEGYKYNENTTNRIKLFTLMATENHRTAPSPIPLFPRTSLDEEVSLKNSTNSTYSNSMMTW